MARRRKPHLVINNDNPAPHGDAGRPDLRLAVDNLDPSRVDREHDYTQDESSREGRRFVSEPSPRRSKISDTARIEYTPTKATLDLAHCGLELFGDAMANLRAAVEALQAGDAEKASKCLGRAECDTRWGRTCLADAHARMTRNCRPAAPRKPKKPKPGKAKASPHVRGKSR